MNIIRDIQKNKEVICSAILKHGHLAQHHYDLYLNYAREGEEYVYFDFEQQKGVFGYQKKDVWRILTEPSAPQNEKKEILVQAIDWAFSQKAKKIIMEDFSEELRKELGVVSKNTNWRVSKPSYSLTWPIVDLENWTGAGGDWKRLRNLYNKFFKEYQAEIKKPDEVKAEDLKKMILSWKKQRNDTDLVHLLPYLRFVENGFAGCGVVRILVCQDKPISITAGWSIPNSQGAYYSCIGIYNYEYKNIGEVSYWDEMVELKKLGYKKLDLGGSEGGLLEFKIKFHPISNYKTDVFFNIKKIVNI